MDKDHGLGNVVAEYRISGTGYVKLFAIMAVTLAIGGAMIGSSVTSHDPNVVGRVILFILGLLFLLPTALGVYSLARGRKNVIRIHERGIVVHAAGEDDEVPFDAVDTYSDGRFLVIVTRTGETLGTGLGGLADAQGLFARLREEIVVKRQVPEVLEALAGGDVAEFGSEPDAGAAGEPTDEGFALDAQGVTLTGSQRRLAWSEITEFGATSKEVAAGGRMTRTAHLVFLETKADTIAAEIEPLSQRELFIELCDKLKHQDRDGAASAQNL